MKKGVFQILIILVLSIGMISTTVIINHNKNIIDDSYFPTQTSTDSMQMELLLSDYRKVNLTENAFPLFGEIIQSEVYFDEVFSYEDILLDDIAVKIGDKIVDGTYLGTLDDIDVHASTTAIVVDVNAAGIKIKNIAKTFAKFSFNIYKLKVYYIGDEFDVYKNGHIITSAKIIDINYFDVIDDCVEVTLEVNNDEIQFINRTSIDLIEKGYEVRTSFAVRSRDLNIFDLEYQNTDRFFEFLLLKEGVICQVNVYIGISFWGYSEVLSINSGTAAVEIGEGDLYVKAAN